MNRACWAVLPLLSAVPLALGSSTAHAESILDDLYLESKFDLSCYYDGNPCRGGDHHLKEPYKVDFKNKTVTFLDSHDVTVPADVLSADRIKAHHQCGVFSETVETNRITGEARITDSRPHSSRLELTVELPKGAYRTVTINRVSGEITDSYIDNNLFAHSSGRCEKTSGRPKF
jgi:hypothetical protein